MVNIDLVRVAEASPSESMSACATRANRAKRMAMR
jgi:hypothetical protein